MKAAEGEAITNPYTFWPSTEIGWNTTTQALCRPESTERLLKLDLRSTTFSEAVEFVWGGITWCSQRETRCSSPPHREPLHQRPTPTGPRPCGVRPGSPDGPGRFTTFRRFLGKHDRSRRLLGRSASRRFSSTLPSEGRFRVPCQAPFHYSVDWTQESVTIITVVISHLRAVQPWAGTLAAIIHRSCEKSAKNSWILSLHWYAEMPRNVRLLGSTGGWRPSVPSRGPGSHSDGLHPGGRLHLGEAS